MKEKNRIHFHIETILADFLLDFLDIEEVLTSWVLLSSVALLHRRQKSKSGTETEAALVSDSDVDIDEEDSTEIDLKNCVDVPDSPLTQGWDPRLSRLSLVQGSVSRQPQIRSFSWVPRTLLSDQSGRPRRICVSDSKGMSPQTMSWRRIPRDQTVKPSAVYRLYLIHSGGAYTRVPSKSL